MVETIITSLILMLVSSLGFIAYKHPDYFTKKLYLLIFAVATIIVVCITIWNIALTVARISLIGIMQIDKINAAEKIINELQINQIITSITFMALMVYLIILLFIATGLKDRK